MGGCRASDEQSCAVDVENTFCFNVKAENLNGDLDFSIAFNGVPYVGVGYISSISACYYHSALEQGCETANNISYFDLPWDYSFEVPGPTLDDVPDDSILSATAWITVFGVIPDAFCTAGTVTASDWLYADPLAFAQGNYLGWSGYTCRYVT